MEVLSIDGLSLNVESIGKKLHVQDLELLNRLWAKIGAVMAPKAAYGIGYVDEKRTDSVVIDGICFQSRVLYQNLNGIGRVFPFVMTIGPAVDELIKNEGNMLESYLLDQLGNNALRQLRLKLEDHLRKKFAFEKISCMSPGSLADWPIEEQKPLFELLGPVKRTIGVRLTDSFLMLPCKSVSGIYFPSEVSFFSCQLCPRERCDSRKAKYDERKVRQYGISSN
jgi:hypothetical protein